MLWKSDKLTWNRDRDSSKNISARLPIQYLGNIILNLIACTYRNSLKFGHAARLVCGTGTTYFIKDVAFANNHTMKVI